VGKIGPQHLEYFKTLERVRNTKMELIRSSRLQKAFVHESTNARGGNVQIFGDGNIRNLHSDLEGTRWDLALGNTTLSLQTSILGAFNATNISAAVMVARELGIPDETIQKAVSGLVPVEHRLQKIITPQKVILDDSFNGNLEGMLEAFRLASTYEGRKVLVTPGVVESDEESNIKLAQSANAIFDLVLITGTVNADLLAHHIEPGRRKRVFDKRGMETILAHETREGDLILFANDTPEFL